MKSFLTFIISSFLFLSGCFSLKPDSIDDSESYQEASTGEINALKKQVHDLFSRLENVSIASTVKLTKSLGTRTIEQVLISQGTKFRSTWFAPSYVQTLAFLVNSDGKRLYCDVTASRCWDYLPENSTIEDVESFLSLKGLSLNKLILGLPFDFTQYENVNIKKKLVNDEFLVEGEENNLKFLTHLKNRSGSLRPEKLFFTRKQSGRRLMEIKWIYNEEKLEYPEKVELNLLDHGIRIEFLLKKVSTNAFQGNSQIFNLDPPSGFSLN